MKSFVEIDKDSKGNYIKLLSVVSKLSGLFSQSVVPYINYRVIENIFCRSFNAKNLSRSDTAFDANYNSIGVGIKTFICNTNHSNEKIAEFNSLSNVLKKIDDKDLAIKLGEYRNERINLAKRVYDIKNALYHIVARKEKELLLFETDYNYIDVNNIHFVKKNKASLQFEDGKNLYYFNYSKNTLFRKFLIPKNAFKLPIEIIEDPYNLLFELLKQKDLKSDSNNLIKGQDFVVLPLYSTRDIKIKEVAKKSGLNQWNASGRIRDLGEVYIPIPAKIHNDFPKFFPKRDKEFYLQIPTGEKLNAKVCQDNSKALMTNPNNALSNWLLRNVLKLKEGELATIEKLDLLGFDSVIILKLDNENYKIDIMKTNSFVEFKK